MRRKRVLFRRAVTNKHLRMTFLYIHGFLLWVLIGALIGCLGGLVGTAFCYSVGFATTLRTAHSWLVWMLPLGGLLIVWMYGRIGLHPTDTNGVLLAIHSPSAISASTGPLIFISTTITHLFGGSAGREGAALQLGGVLGHSVGKWLHMDEKDQHLVVMCGMSAVFAALFGSPITAAIFSLEVASVGILHFSAILPCLVASLTSAHLASLLGAHAETFPIVRSFTISFGSVGGATLIAAVCAAVSILYCISLRRGGKFWAKKIPNPYVRVVVAGALIALLTFFLRTGDYNGAGMNVIAAAVEGNALPAAFALKFLFTVITMASGYKGGEIVPAMFIGSTLGCVLGSFLGLEPGLGAAVGLIGMFCGSLNCPISSIFLGIELFGAGNVQFYAIASAVSFILSANFGLYKEQKIVYSKLHPEFINRYTDE